MGIFKRYTNPHIKGLRRTLFHFIGWFAGLYKENDKIKVPEDFSYPMTLDFSEDKPSATFVNHSTYLVNAMGCHFLTDPIWSKRCSPFSFLGPKRLHDPHLQINEIKKLDFVLISHNHYDHLDSYSIKEIYKHFPDVTFVVPLGVKKWFLKQGIDQVVELGWWQNVNFKTDRKSPSIEVTAVPAQHHSGRRLFDANKSLWAGFVVTIKDQKDEKCFYFAGDTAYNSYDFKNIGVRFKNIDLSLCPIGTYRPKKFMETVHLSPEGAVAIHKDLKAKLSLGMHWGTFRLSEEPRDAPPYDLYNEMQKQSLNFSTFLPIEPGTSVNW
ncbi:MAG: hypothetical protein S4CHLAM20_15020 [Chlamydiia bacterium]|nr:hypothetical protein [Chlamydiia bacterium]